MLRFAVLAVAILSAFEPAYAAQSQLSARLSFPSDKALKDYSPSEAMNVLETIWKSKDPALPEVVSDSYKIYAFYNRKIISDEELNMLFVEVVQKIYLDKAKPMVVDSAIEAGCKEVREETRARGEAFDSNMRAVFRGKESVVKAINNALGSEFEKIFKEMSVAPKLRCIELIRAKDWEPIR